ncbi:MAG: 2-C-methyl-D-erythritol 2,4-cyclodiphosphate synthase [Phycisphaerales bacterium JB050]
MPDQRTNLGMQIGGMRIGHGYDLHRLEPVDPGAGSNRGGRPLVLAGVRIDSPIGPVGHSDGDALFHAITDALLGALGMDDIGTLFPDDDSANDGRASIDFVKEAMRRVRGAGYGVGNLDCTVILEHPRLKSRRTELREAIANALEIGVDRVNVKGKSHEGLDAIGEGRAIEVHAMVLLVSDGVVGGND